MLVLVTGGAGFIGGHVAEALLAAGHDVRLLDNLHPAAHAAVPDDLPEGAELLRGDVREGADVDAALEGVDAVCHQAAMVGLGHGHRRHRRLRLPQRPGHRRPAAHARGAGYGGRLVQASSMVVYGEGRYACPSTARSGRAPRGRRPGGRALRAAVPALRAPARAAAVPEDAPLDPRNVYAATKLQQEHLAAAFSRETGVPVTSLRYHNVYGPRMPRDTPYAGRRVHLRQRAGRRPGAAVFEDGGQLRDFVHVRDIARANVLALTAAEPVPGAFNVCSGVPRSVGDMARALWEAAEDGAPEPEVTGAFRLGDVRHVFASAERARDVLGFSAREDFRAGMAEFARAKLRAPTG
jgi:dTDP-L-rhamnose 4-epimerase